MLRHSFFTTPVFAVLAAVDAIACFAPGGPMMAAMFHHLASSNMPYGSGITAFGIHSLVSFLAAVLGAAALPQAAILTRCTICLFVLVLTFAIPVLGILITAALALILCRPATGGIRPEERYVFGNPEATAARRGSRAAPPTLTPLAEGFRSMDEDTLCRAILGLQHLGPARALAPFLQRFQQDPRTSVQFTAQAVLSRATETLEETIRALRQRLEPDPANFETCLALAETLDQLTAWTPPGDATTTIRRREATVLASSILTAHPDDARALRLLARLQLAAAHGTAAQATALQLAGLDPSGDPAGQQALVESLFHQARWDDLAAAARLTVPSPGGAEPLNFWITSPISHHQ